MHSAVGLCRRLIRRNPTYDLTGLPSSAEFWLHTNPVRVGLETRAVWLFSDSVLSSFVLGEGSRPHPGALARGHDTVSLKYPVSARIGPAIADSSTSAQVQRPPTTRGQLDCAAGFWRNHHG